MTPKFHGKVDKNCKLLLVHWEGFNKRLFFLKGRQVVLTIKSVKEDRPDPLRKYYFGVAMDILAEHTGHSKEAIHEAMKVKYASYESTGLTLVRSVFSHGSTMTQKEKEKFILDVRRWASDFLDVNIPARGNVEC